MVFGDRDPLALKARSLVRSIPHPPFQRDQKSGDRVKMSGPRLRQQSVSTPESTVLVVCYQHNPDEVDQLEPVGHVFATAWDYEGGNLLAHGHSELLTCPCKDVLVG